METDIKTCKKSRVLTDKSSSAGSKVFDPELESFTKKKLFGFETFSSQKNQKHQTPSLEIIIKQTLFALKHYYGQQQSEFFLSCKQFLLNGHKSNKSQIIERLSIFNYIQQSLRYKQFTCIEVQIIRQWQRNKLLHQIIRIWVHSILKSFIKTLKQFKVQYDLFRELISQVSHFIFKSWFKIIQKHKKIQILDKLFDQTSHFIITQGKPFKKLYSLMLEPMIQSQIKSNQSFINWDINLEQLTFKKCIFNSEKQQNLSDTIDSLKKFSSQIRLSKKLQYLQQIRVSFEKQVIQNQRHLIQIGQISNYQILQKDDIITAYIYCIIAGQVENLQSSLNYLHLLLGKDQGLLEALKISMHAIDLVAAVGYLCQDNNKNSALITHPVHSKFVKTESNPEVDFETKRRQATTIGSFQEITEESSKIKDKY